MSKKTKTIFWIVTAVLAVAVIGFLISDFINQGKELFINDFVEKLRTGEINKLYVDGYAWTGLVVEGGKVTAEFTTVGPSIYDFSS